MPLRLLLLRYPQHLQHLPKCRLPSLRIAHHAQRAGLKPTNYPIMLRNQMMYLLCPKVLLSQWGSRLLLFLPYPPGPGSQYCQLIRQAPVHLAASAPWLPASAGAVLAQLASGQAADTHKTRAVMAVVMDANPYLLQAPCLRTTTKSRPSKRERTRAKQSRHLVHLRRESDPQPLLRLERIEAVRHALGNYLLCHLFHHFAPFRQSPYLHVF